MHHLFWMKYALFSSFCVFFNFYSTVLVFLLTLRYFIVLQLTCLLVQLSTSSDHSHCLLIIILACSIISELCFEISDAICSRLALVSVSRLFTPPTAIFTSYSSSLLVLITLLRAYMTFYFPTYCIHFFATLFAAFKNFSRCGFLYHPGSTASPCPFLSCGAFSFSVHHVLCRPHTFR